jgi:hypothetical protein
MDFIHYSPTNELLILNKVSSDEMDIEEVALEYGYIESFICFDTADRTLSTV